MTTSTRRGAGGGAPALPSVDPAAAARYREAGWWGDRTTSGLVAERARSQPDDTAYVVGAHRFSWAAYDRIAVAWAATLVGLGLEAGGRVAVLLPDGAAVHVALVAIERAGLVAVGIGARAGDREVAHLVGLTGADVLLTHEDVGRRSATELRGAVAALGPTYRHHLVVPRLPADDTRLRDDHGPVAPGAPDLLAGRALGPDDLAMLNSTSGTTGLPKCVVHTQDRWFYFHDLAAGAGELDPSDVFLAAVPAPFGFGLWTSHFSPTALGCPTVVLERFDAVEALDLIERERVTVLCCVSTQFIMLLNALDEHPRDLSSLRCMFTGGEAVPYERAAHFEEVTGAAVLQFYGSNETGALSVTTTRDPRDRRLRTAGKTIAEMEVRLFDPETGVDVTATGRGQPAARGPATCLGYWGDDQANEQLYTPDGWMLMGDIVEIDDDGYLRVIGRTSDIIIRGGKNVSAAAVEAEVGTHPAVAMVAAVAAPDEVFGERVCAYVTLHPGAALSLADLLAHLTDRGVSREWFPEYLVVLDELPRSSGSKVSKGELREDAGRRFGSGRGSGPDRSTGP